MVNRFKHFASPFYIFLINYRWPFFPLCAVRCALCGFTSASFVRLVATIFFHYCYYYQHLLFLLLQGSVWQSSQVKSCHLLVFTSQSGISLCKSKALAKYEFQKKKKKVLLKPALSSCPLCDQFSHCALIRKVHQTCLLA